MNTDIDDITEIIGKDVETMRDNKDKESLPLITKKMTSKSMRQDEGGLFLFMEKAQALGFSFEECQKLFLLYRGHL